MHQCKLKLWLIPFSMLIEKLFQVLQSMIEVSKKGDASVET